MTKTAKTFSRRAWLSKNSIVAAVALTFAAALLWVFAGHTPEVTEVTIDGPVSVIPAIPVQISPAQISSGAEAALPAAVTR